jgi:hypothetical protein
LQFAMKAMRPSSCLRNSGLFPSVWQLRVTDPCVDVEFWLGSRITEASVEPPEHDTEPRSAREMQKRRNFHSEFRKFQWLSKFWIGKNGHTSPPCWFEWKSPISAI